VLLFALNFFAGGFLIPLSLGLYQGLQNFTGCAFVQVSASAIKLILGVLLIAFGLNAVVLGSGAAPCLVFLAFVLFFRKKIKLPLGKLPGSFFRNSFWLALANFLILSFFYVDVILVKHFFDPVAAGSYIALTVPGKLLFLLPETIIAVFFPMTVAAKEKGKSAVGLLIKAFLGTGLIAGPILVLFWLFPEWIMSIMNVKYVDVASHLFKYSIAMAIVAFGRVLINFWMAKNQYRFLFSLILALLVLIILISYLIYSFLNIVIKYKFHSNIDARKPL